MALRDSIFYACNNLDDNGAWKIIQKRLKGKIGDNDSEVIRNIVLAYLSEKSYIKSETER